MKLKLPLKSKLFVAMKVQFVNGCDKFVEVRTKYVQPDVPFVPLKIKLPEEISKPEMRGDCVGEMEMIRSVPSLASVFVLHAKPVAGDAGTMFVKTPE